MARITFVVESFDTPGKMPLAHANLEALLETLTDIDVQYLLTHPGTPLLYESGVRYKEEPPGQEDWLDIPSALAAAATGQSVDCEDIACWRTAELRVRFGVAAKPTFAWVHRPDGTTLYHIQVLYPNGLVEDPCRKLGMK